MTALFPFPHQAFRITHQGVELAGRASEPSALPPLVLLHGHPQTHAMWHRVATQLAQLFRLVMLDLRGYGDSGRPESDPDHAPYSKREMAHDVLAVMQHFGYARFAVLAHDRGARVAHRLAIDHPQAVDRMLLLDIAPTLAMYEGTHARFASAYWHWFFLIQPPPLPEALIDSDPVRYVRQVMGQRHAGLAAFAPQAMAEYERCIQRLGSARAICEDYRASASIDLDHDRATRDSGLKIQMPLRVLWGEHGAVGANFDVLGLWRECASNVTGRSLPCGHYIAEEAPDQLIREALDFFELHP